eukprot:5289683-Ditylum_brightwellii.AAC.1
MFLKGRVCIYKPNPVNHGTIDILEHKILKPLVDLGYVAFVKGGARVGSTLVQDEHIDEIVITGSALTLDKIQWGATLQEQTENKQANTPIIQTPICSELGAVNSWVIVPGSQWNRKNVDKHASALAFAKLANNGHICASPQVVVLPKDWVYRDEFIDRLRFWLAQHPGSAPFYPGSDKSHAYFQGQENAEIIEGTSPDNFPNQQRPILIRNVSIDNQDLLSREAWCPVLMELPIEYERSEEDPMGYLEYAVRRVETKSYGSLGL